MDREGDSQDSSVPSLSQCAVAMEPGEQADYTSGVCLFEPVLVQIHEDYASSLNLKSTDS